MSNTTKFWISALITLGATVSLLIWSSNNAKPGTTSIISPVAIIFVEYAILQLLARIFKFGKYGKPVEKK